MEKKTTFAPLGVVIYRDSSVGDELFCGCAEYLQLLGHRLGGVVQSNVYRSGRLKCDMYLRDLLTCERIEISNNRGNGANGCRLDGSALARACVLGSQALRANIDLFVLNKFGKERIRGQRISLRYCRSANYRNSGCRGRFRAEYRKSYRFRWRRNGAYPGGTPRHCKLGS